MIVIVVMGIVLAIASSSWFGVIESRQVDAATNQLATDLRLMHTQASNRLAPYRVVLDGDSTYQVGLSTDLEERVLPDGATVSASATFVFDPSGSVSGSPTTFQVRASDGSPDHQIELNPTTSKVTVVD
jgi:Tfp pilus assembly protein FimT